MTVKELREALAGLPDDLVVIMEGCDCEEVAGEVVIDTRHYTYDDEGTYVKEGFPIAYLARPRPVRSDDD